MKPAVIRIAILLGSALIALMVMGRIADKTTGQVVAILIAMAGLIVSRVVYARMMRQR